MRHVLTSGLHSRLVNLAIGVLMVLGGKFTPATAHIETTCHAFLLEQDADGVPGISQFFPISVYAISFIRSHGRKLRKKQTWHYPRSLYDSLRPW